MASRYDIVRLADWWAWPGEYKPSAEELRSFFVDAGAEDAPPLANAEKALAAGGTGVKLSNGEKRHWCGIFATAVLRDAGVDCHWTLFGGKVKGKGVSGALPHSYPARPTSQELRPGDIAIIRRSQHHFIVTDVDYANNQVYCVEGNTSGQIIRRAVRAISYSGTQSQESIYAFYRFIG
jgi:hypothetical protein